MKQLLILAFPLFFLYHANGQEKDKSFSEFKQTIEGFQFPPFKGNKIQFNAFRYEVNLDNSKDTLIVKRIKIPDVNYSDPSNDREIKMVALKDINKDSLTIDTDTSSYRIRIFCKGQNRNVKYILYKLGDIQTKYNSQLGIGPFPQNKFSKENMDHLVKLMQGFL